MAAKATKKKVTTQAPEETERIVEAIEELAKQFPPNIRNTVRQAAPYLAKAWMYFLTILPYVVRAVREIQTLIEMLPDKILWAVLSFLVCFFGGIFPATIAAAEAWNACGGVEAWEQAKILLNEFMKVAEATKEEAKEEDKDAQKLAPQQVVQKKLAIALAVMEPDKVSGSISSIYVGWIGVIGVLRFKFAQTITLGEVIGAKVYKPVSKLEPVLESLIAEEYQKWVPTATRWACKFTAICIGWWIQRVISAFHSAIRGGMIFGEYLVDFLHEKGYLQVEHKDTYIDEAIGWSIAALGFLTQLALGFQLPLLFKFVLFPVYMLEVFIVWSVGA
mmetsp:Transcript_39800/g.92093  ORF Transcript_39800/g.92093 Transcript_39800/m.92093 type:complete len:333 (-) Transcript_39800:40-1038(-)